MDIVLSDLEGVFVPEIWINVAERTGIDDLRLTTRDISDYDVLMKRRLGILAENGLKLKDITDVIAGMSPLDGALEFLSWLRSRVPVIVVSDTFSQFAGPLMEKLGRPALLCHTLDIAADGTVAGYRLRQVEAKRHAVEAMKGLNYRTIAMGDSYNDIGMLTAAHEGILFRPPQNVVAEFPQFPVTQTYAELKTRLEKILKD
ncbi:MAG: bifunctional phosphoserine phosphatase/homoserine phosphotransferase ThrH [Pseudomonadota bacterium]